MLPPLDTKDYDNGLETEFPNGISIIDLPQIVQKMEAEKGNTEESLQKIQNYLEVFSYLNLTLSDKPLNVTKDILATGFNAGGGANSGVTLIPEYDKNGNIIPNKFAGKLLFAPQKVSQANGESKGLKMKYIPLDPNYTGDLGRIYGYVNSGDGGSNGFLTIKLENQSAEKTVHETIHYVDESNKTLAPDYKDSVDLTTDNNWKTFKSNKDFRDVTSPVIKGYTPDKTVVKGVKVDGNTKDLIVTVTYKKNAVPAQTKTVHEVIHYIDESNKTLAPDFTDQVTLISKDGGKTWTGDKPGFCYQGLHS